MKKTSKLFLATSMALVLAACGNTNTDEEDLTPENEQTEQTEDAENTEDTGNTEEPENDDSDTADTENSSEDDVDEDDMATVPEEELENTETVSDHENYEELSAQDYFDPAEYNSRLVTDNPGTRIFIFENEGKQAYKTIYIKKANRLKVIDLVNDELLMNEVIN